MQALLRVLALLLAAGTPGWARAAGMDGGQLSVLWGVPFAGMLLSIALVPLAAPHFWHRHFGKVTAAWALAFLLPFSAVFGPVAAWAHLLHALLAEYLPFVILLTALYTVSGGIYVRGNLKGTPGLNTAILAIGAVLASFMGTTGASMLLIRPLLRANDNRRHQVHVVVFFIFIVSNAGGSLTPLLAVVALVLMSGLWRTDAGLVLAGTHVGLPGLVRDAGLIAVTLLSLRLTPRSVHQANEFGWGPMQEVAKLFAGIFLTIIPVIAMLKAGTGGPFGAIVGAVTRADGTPDPLMYFWATGLLSSFLDNAPTYLVFFNTAGGDAAQMMTTMAPTLAAISAGAVFMGANTYIGNAPNLMVKAIAEERGVKMPSFFGYMAWSLGILVPLFVLMGFIWFR
jgi:Na+/H+ antiporter NhaD/arsenite permease-like protein